MSALLFVVPVLLLAVFWLRGMMSDMREHRRLGKICDEQEADRLLLAVDPDFARELGIVEKPMPTRAELTGRLRRSYGITNAGRPMMLSGAAFVGEPLSQQPAIPPADQLTHPLPTGNMGTR